MNKEKYVVLNGCLNKSGIGDLDIVAYASSLKKAKEIANLYVKGDKVLREKSVTRNGQLLFVTAIQLNSDDVFEYKFYKEI